MARSLGTLIMVAARAMGNHTTITVAGAGGQLQLNACKPVIIDAFLQSARLLADACESFTDNCIVGITADRKRIAANSVENSLMLVTSLTRIGYDNAAAIARQAHTEGLSLREAALATGLITEVQFDLWIRPQDMDEVKAITHVREHTQTHIRHRRPRHQRIA